MKKSQENTAVKNIWLNDAPIVAGSDGDLLDRQEVVNRLATSVRQMAASSRSGVIGLVGPWGSGKTSVMNQLAADIQDDRWEIVQFNPWYYSDEASLMQGFYQELSVALPKSVTKGLNALGALIGRMAPLGNAASIFGINGEAIGAGISKLLAPDKSMPQLIGELEECLERANKNILVMIDDLDRIGPDELLLLFKLVRLTGNLRGVYYLVAYDDQTLLDTVSSTSLVPLGDSRRAQDYLEKIVQMRVHVPPLREAQAKALFFENMSEFLSTLAVSLTESEQKRLRDVQEEWITELMRTPRAIKQYFSALSTSLAQVEGEIDFGDFALLTWVRIRNPFLYQAIYDRKRELLFGDIWYHESAVLARKELWSQQFSAWKLDAETETQYVRVLSALFPRFEAIWEAKEYHDQTERLSGRRIYESEYFERYFSLSVPREDFPDATVELGIDQYANGVSGSERDSVQQALVDRTQFVARKLTYRALADVKYRLPVLRWFRETQAGLGEIDQTDTSGAHGSLRTYFAILFSALEPSELVGATEEFALEGPAALGLLARGLVSWQRSNDLDDPIVAETYTSAVGSFVKSCRVWMDTVVDDKDVTDIQESDWAVVWWWSWYDKASLRRWLSDETEKQGWNSLDMAARFVQHGLSQVTGNQELVLDDAILREVLDRDRLLQALEEEENGVVLNVPAAGAVDGWAERRKAVKIAVRRETIDVLAVAEEKHLEEG